MANDLTTIGRGLIPSTMSEVAKMAETVHNSRLAPYGIDTPQKVFVCICHGLEVGLAPMAAIQSIAVINGRPCMWGEALLGLVHASGMLEDMQETLDEETMTATCTMKRKGVKSPVVRTFSKADAELAGLWGKTGKSGQPTPWVSYPKRMLQMRARGFAIRDAFPDVTKGLAVREEMEDVVLVNPPDPQAEKESKLARLQAEVGGTDGEGFNADMVDTELEALSAPETDEIDDGPDDTGEETDTATEPAINPAGHELLKEVHKGLYTLNTHRAINTRYRTKYLETVSSMDNMTKDTIESLVLKHLDRVDGKVEPKDIADFVREQVAFLKPSGN